MRGRTSWRFPLLVLLGAVFFFGLSGQRPARAGGPLFVGGPPPNGVGSEGVPNTWNTASAIKYKTDGGPLGKLTNTQAIDRVKQMFDVWEAIGTATISYVNDGQITGGDGDVSTAAEFNTVEGSCLDGTQSPIVFDTDGNIFMELIGDPNVIGFAGPCAFNRLSGAILSGEAALNGRFIDDIDTPFSDPPNDELSDAAFDAAFIHEFGHFSGLDHSQINLNCIVTGCAVGSADAFGLPTMFPFLISSLEESVGNPAQLTLSPDDIAWISFLYPDTSFSTTFGTIEGTILFTDGQTPAQGVNVIARLMGDERRTAVSVVSGFLFTGNPGQPVTGTNAVGDPFFGSRDPSLIGFYSIPGLPPGNYTVEVESIDEGFDGGSSVGPLDPPIAMPGAAPPAAGPFAVSAGGTVTGGTDITLVGTPPRFDQFEGP